MKMDYEVIHHGESTVEISLGKTIDMKINLVVHAFFSFLTDNLNNRTNYIVDFYPTYHSIFIDFNELETDFYHIKQKIDELIKEFEIIGFDDNSKKEIIDIPVSYGGKDGFDLEKLSTIVGLSEKEVIQIHTKPLYKVFLIGFMPGFPYLGGLDKRISCLRLETPRSKIPEGSVGIAGDQTGIYPFATPGGWRIIGKTELKLFEIDKIPPTKIPTGSFVKFIEV